MRMGLMLALMIGILAAFGCKKGGGDNACTKLADKMCKIAPDSNDCKEGKEMAGKASADEIKQCEEELKGMP